MKNWTKTPQGYSHSTGVTLVKISPASTAWAVLTPNQPLQKLGSFAAASKAGRLAVAALTA
jgi:hypothetical protein